MGFFRKSESRHHAAVVQARHTDRSVASVFDDKLYNALFADRFDDFLAMKDHEAISWIYNGKTITAREINVVLADPAVESRIIGLPAKYRTGVNT